MTGKNHAVEQTAIGKQLPSGSNENREANHEHGANRY